MRHLRSTHPAILQGAEDGIPPVPRPATDTAGPSKQGSAPFTIVEDEGFRAFVKKLDPSYVLPSRKVLKAMVSERYDKAKEKTMEDLQKAEFVSLTANMWSSINMDGYLAQVTSGQIFTTPPGGFPCKTIMHVCGERDASVIKTLAKAIVVQCEHGRYRSVAIPAICAGQGALDAKVVAKSILEGVKDGVQGANLQYLRTIRIILLKINVFLEFKAMAQQIFGGNTQLTAPAPLVPTNVTSRGRSGSTISRRSQSRRSQSFSLQHSLDLSSLVSALPVTENTAAFLVIGHTDNEVCDACRELQRAYESQCSTHSFHPEEIERLTQDEMNQLLSKVDSLHLKLEQSSSGGWELKGLKDGVNEVVRLIQDALRRQVREKDQASLFTQVTWCILGPRGVWQKVPPEENYKLEREDVKDGIIDAQGVKWTVDLRKLEATACGSGHVTSLKRLENLLDFSLPINWDNMSHSDLLKVIALDQQSMEYQTVKADFKKTVTKTVLKV
ncbi:uncharacterized protein LOC130070380 [Rhinichthys klamathensis goyatoka]|uniref:uncharacterized protein LOC130070380 n=1 Tax=Rhinichthys klamathensis goyatoka TaxID=3034132 RepID=UPI0024B61AD2|nr:uncharacterized protein LOC130070380 [Rhinichthys klamathensis goyatoka]